MKIKQNAIQARKQGRSGGGGRGVNALTNWANYFKIMHFSQETAFTSLILASNSEFS